MMMMPREGGAPIGLRLRMKPQVGAARTRRWGKAVGGESGEDSAGRFAGDSAGRFAGVRPDTHSENARVYELVE